MDGHLLDRDGFPRDDIDVYQVRTLRHEMARNVFFILFYFILFLDIQSDMRTTHRTPI